MLMLTNVDDLNVAKKIARHLISKKMVIGVNIMPKGYSINNWQGEIVEKEEYSLLIKTLDGFFKDVANEVKAIHPYEIPEIILIQSAHGSPEYFDLMCSCFDWKDEEDNEEQ